MRERSDGPLVARAGDALGVRLPGQAGQVDVHPGLDGYLEPKHEGRCCGMSAIPDDPRRGYTSVKPKALGGKSGATLYELDLEHLPSGLLIFRDSDKHVTVYPAARMHLDEYEALLLQTRPAWSKTHVAKYL